MNSAHLYRRNFLLHLQKRAGYDQTVLLKEPAHEQPVRLHLDQLHNEYAITSQLADVAGVRPAYAMEGTESQPRLLLEYIPGESLTELIRSPSLDMAEKLRLAVNVAIVLNRIHNQQVMHKDISSANILVAGNDEPGSQDGVYIIDFGIASTMRQENPSRLAPDDSLVGTLAYISPEQTGRMNRQVDYRTDLYSLGVVLYELFTGQLPIEGDDVLAMIHAHIARQPQPPHQIDAGIPGPVSDIILKLLTKNAEDRYQTAHGLQADLKHCLDQWQNKEQIEPFELGTDDFVGRLQIPQKLYGRQAEIEQLQTILDRAVTGSAQLLLVAGYSGVGKTFLVHEIQRDVIAKQAIFIEGKFDQLQRTLPYSAWAQAFTQLVNHWLGVSETSLAGWRETILDALGDNGQILIDIIPALERIIGPQPEVPQLGGVEAQNRFSYILNRFISSLATPEHPLVVFLDDLQWIDPASLNLIEALLTVQTTSSFLLMGAYRDNEVGPDHPLTASLGRMSAYSEQVTVTTLADLAPDATTQLLVDSLELPAADCRELSQVLVEKTGGNPFYFHQLLYAMESEGLLRFDRAQRRWVWEEALLQNLQARGSVVDLMIEKIRMLPTQTQRTLSMAACLGSQFDTAKLGIIIGQPETDILTALSPALQGGLIVRSNGHFSFTHDRIQEAGYALIPKPDLPITHLEIGRLLLMSTTPEDLEEEIFAIVGHLNAGWALIERDSEKIDLAALNLKAGQKAKVASAFSDGKRYVEIGLELLGEDCWQDDYELALSLHTENAELALLNGQFDQVAAFAKLIHVNARNTLDQIRIYMTRIEAETMQHHFPKALEIGLRVLEELDIQLPARPTSSDAQRLNHKLVDLLTSKPLETVAELPAMTDETALAVSSILAAEMSTSYIVDPPLYPIISYQGALLTLEFGHNTWSAFFFAGIALVAFSAVENETSADEAHDLLLLGKQMQAISHELLNNSDTVRSRTKVLQILGQIAHWTNPIETALEMAQATFQSRIETGDLLYSAYGTVHAANHGLASGINLEAYQRLISDYVQFWDRLDQQGVVQWLSIFLQTAQHFEELSPTPHRLIGAYFAEDDWLLGAAVAGDIPGRHLLYVFKLLLSYHFDVDSELDECILRSEEFLTGGLGMVSYAVFYFYSALARLRLSTNLNEKDRAQVLKLVDGSLRLMKAWSETAPSTFQHKVDLIAAEKARVTGDLEGALAHYELAINGARKSDFTHEEALANELYARFWAERDNDRFAVPLMREAHSLYQKWGAHAKAEHLTKRYPNWLISRHIVVDQPVTQPISDEMTGDLDLLTVLKASQDIASELALDGLLAKLMTNVIENSGAQQGYLILEQDGQWDIVAEAVVDDTETYVTAPKSIAETDLVAQGIVQYVARTQETVVLDDASQSGEFVSDPYIQSQQARSILCTPLINHGKTSGILYLENDLASNVFSHQRVNLLQLLSAQMAISIDNARTHDHLERLLEERSKALDSAEAQVRTLFKNSPLGIALTSYNGNVLAANRAILEMLRITVDEVLQRSVIDFYRDPGDRETLLNELDKAGSVQDFGVQLVRNDGSSFFASLNISQLVLEGNDVLLAMVEDVTDEITAEQEAATLEERARVARELHDSVTQALFTTTLFAQAGRKGIESGDLDGAAHHLTRILETGHQALKEMRLFLYELLPEQLVHLGLVDAIRQRLNAVEKRAGLKVSFAAGELGDLPGPVNEALYRITQEALNNSLKHAQADAVTVTIHRQGQRLCLEIIDDGQGFDPLEARGRGGLGLISMRERAEKLGGAFNIDSAPQAGTKISVALEVSR